MLNRFTGALVALIVASVAAAQPAAPQAVWTVAADILTPESVYYDAASNALFVSNINGEILGRDGNGYISRLTPPSSSPICATTKWRTLWPTSCGDPQT